MTSTIRRPPLSHDPGRTPPDEIRAWLDGAVLPETGLSLSGRAVSAVLGAWPSAAGGDRFDALLTAVGPKGERWRLASLALFLLSEDGGQAWLHQAQATARGELRFVGLRRGAAHRLRAPSIWGVSEPALAPARGGAEETREGEAWPAAATAALGAPVIRPSDSRLSARVRLAGGRVAVGLEVGHPELEGRAAELYLIGQDGRVAARLGVSLPARGHDASAELGEFGPSYRVALLVGETGGEGLLAENSEASRAALATRIELLEQERNRARKYVAELHDSLISKEQLLAASQQESQHLKRSLESAREELSRQRVAWERARQELKARKRGMDSRLQCALSKVEKAWNEKVPATEADPFKPLDPEGRRMPILAVLSLDGGVGKTTITAYLASALDGMGYRVLVLDLDLRGSLTGQFLPEDRQVELANGRLLLEDFLGASLDAEYPRLLGFTQPILTPARSGLVPTSDNLAYAEMNLTIHWLLREGNRDVRFLLRRELHSKRVMNRYDIVLLDCPPRVSLCCVNAVAASDYLLVPVATDSLATAGGSEWLRRCKDLRENINPQLNVLGLVANRTFGAMLTTEEQSRMSLLEAAAGDIWGERVTQFASHVPEHIEIRLADCENPPLVPGDTVNEVFLHLAREVESGLPAFCRRGRGE